MNLVGIMRSGENCDKLKILTRVQFQHCGNLNIMLPDLMILFFKITWKFTVSWFAFVLGEGNWVRKYTGITF